MEIFAPDYYHAFTCLASACPDSCCKEWEVDVDATSAAYYRSLPGDLGDRLRQVLRDTEDGTSMVITEGRCPMWREDGLCQIQAELGHDALCRTCREYPRLRHEYGSFTELGLELSCPEAARLILSCDQSGEPVSDPGDDPDLSILLRTRSQLLEFWQNSLLPLPQKLATTLLYSYDVQEELDGGKPAELSADLDEITKQLHREDAENLFDFFRSLEILTDRWKALLGAPTHGFWHPELRNLAIYGIRRYWLQAVSDLDIVCRAKLICAMCLLVAHLDGAPLYTAQLMSKELENDPDNLEAVLDGAYTSPALTDAYLLGLMLEN